MKKLMVFGFSFVILFLFFLILLHVSLVSAIRINEVELNPEGTDTGNEWVELYSEQEVDLSGWTLVNNDNQTLNLSQNFQGYLIINFLGRWLDNSNEKVILKNVNRETIEETIVLNDAYNDNRSWQYCNGNWNFIASTKNSVNFCSQNQTPTQNNSQNNTPSPQKQEAKIYLEMEWQDEIINGEEFEIEVKAFNLKNENYDIKIYITLDNKTIISDTYDETEEKWKSGSYYVNEILAGSGNKSETFNLRIKSSYEDFSGDAKIKAKIRKSGSSSIITEFEKDIEILEKEITEEKETQKDEEETTIETKKETDEKKPEIIRLGNRSNLQKKELIGKNVVEKQEKGKILYESTSEKIKKYAIYALNLVLIVIIIFLLKSKKKV